MNGRDRAVRRVLWGVLGLNLLVVGIKVGVALLTHSVAALAEVIHGALDASANLIGLYGLSVAHQPPDQDHPYGHRRFESLAALAIGVLVALGLVQIVQGLWGALRGERRVPDVTPLALGLLIATVVLNLAISRYEAKRGRALQSSLLLADAGHTLSDGLGVGVVLLSLAVVHFGLPGADLVGAAIVAGLVARTALVILRENVSSLADTAQLDPDAVLATAVAVDGVHGAHKVRSRGLAGHVYVDLHIQVDPHISVVEAHAITHAVKAAIIERHAGVTDVVIHTEPARP